MPKHSGSPAEPLVSDKFVINREIENELIGISSSQYWGYPDPKSRLTMDHEEIAAWIAEGRPYERLRKNPSLRSPFGVNHVMGHPNRESGLTLSLARLDDGRQSFQNISFRNSIDPRSYMRDSRGVPLHPYHKIMLEHGALGGFGWFWDYGPNMSADSIVFVQNEAGLHFPAIKRLNSEIIFLPGGMVDSDEKPLDTATRELFEETTLILGETEAEKVYEGVVAGSSRQTLHAWHETIVFLMTSHKPEIAKMPLTAGDDAGEAFWLPLNEKSLGEMHISHANYVRLAVLVWQRKTGLVVGKDGKINTPTTI